MWKYRHKMFFFDKMKKEEKRRIDEYMKGRKGQKSYLCFIKNIDKVVCGCSWVENLKWILRIIMSRYMYRGDLQLFHMFTNIDSTLPYSQVFQNLGVYLLPFLSLCLIWISKKLKLFFLSITCWNMNLDIKGTIKLLAVLNSKKS